VLLNAVRLAAAYGARVRLAVVGDGELRSELEALAARLEIHDRVHFLGYRRDLRRIAAGADVAVLTSDNEGTPVSLIESAAAGLPAVATAVGGVPDVVTPDVGVVVPPRDPEAFARAVVRLAGDPEVRRRMGERARPAAVRRYSDRRLLADVLGVYNELLERMPVGPPAEAPSKA
jgi:glycosyltransferase involved in cell wall biosynthesis